jgi:hypothetical protein
MDAYRPNFDWQPEHEECVRSMWLAGTSARDIATALDGVVSRGAVIGKVNRLGLMKSPERVILKPIRPKREGEWRRPSPEGTSAGSYRSPRAHQPHPVHHPLV